MYNYSEDYGSLWDVAPRGEGIPIKADGFDGEEVGTLRIEQDGKFLIHIEGERTGSSKPGKDSFIKKCKQLGVKYIEPSKIVKPKGKAGFIEKGGTHGK